MSETKYLNLLILCAILSQEVIGTFANDDIRESSDILSRQKRVVSRVPGEDRSVTVVHVPHVVNVRYLNKIHCVGNILSHYVVITTAQCARHAASEYKIISSSARADRGNTRNVTDIKMHFGSHPQRPFDGIALLTVNPPFVYNPYTKFIELHSGPLLEGILATVSGWGYNCRYDREDRGTSIPTYLRSIKVPIIAHQDCVNRYRAYHRISDEDVCTYHSQKHCGHTDFGAGLVVEGHLAGVFLWSGPEANQINPQYPDVYAILQHSVYNGWIRSNLQNIEAQFQNHQH